MKEMLIGFFIGLFVAHVSASHAATLILNDNSRVQILEGEQVFISKSDLYRKQGDESTGVTYTPADPVLLDPEVVVVPPKPVEPSCLLNGAENPELCALGSVQYCTHFQDREDRGEGQGFTFEYQAFLRACDTDGDNRYNYCDDYTPFTEGYTFADQWWDRLCNHLGNRDFNPTRNRNVGG